MLTSSAHFNLEHWMNPSTNASVKTAISSVLNSLPDDVSWDEVHYRLYVRQQIETGLADSDANRLINTEEMRKRLSDLKRQKHTS